MRPWECLRSTPEGAGSGGTWFTPRAMEGSVASLSAPPEADIRKSSRTTSVPRREESTDSEKAGRVWAREVNDAWEPCFLTCDGGGIRGYSSLLILKALMHEIWLYEQEYDQKSPVIVPTDRPTAPHRVDEQGAITSSSSASIEGQAAAGAARIQIGPNSELENDAHVAQTEYATDSDLPHIYTAPAAAAETLAKDQITAHYSVRKALSEEELLPCHYFDFMFGTSTGGLIATMLGRLRMTVSEALTLYRNVGEDLFGKRRSRMPLMTKYYHEPLEKVVREIVSSRCQDHENCDGNDLHPWNADRLDELLKQPVPFDVDQPRTCQSCCLTATHDESISEAYLLRSYPHFYSENAPNWITRYNEGADAIPIWQATRATTAAPFYFDMLTTVVDDVERSFKDGGIRENNPSAAALSEFHALYEGRAANPALMLSLGTGRPNHAFDGFAAAWPTTFGRLPMVSRAMEKFAVIRNLLIKYTEGEKQHKNMREYAHGEHTWYKRLNVSHGFENMPLDAWERGVWRDPQTQEERVTNGGASLTKMEEATEEYLTRPFEPIIDSYAPPRTMLKQAAQKLVLQRRAREELGGPRWDTFAGKKPHASKDKS